jgi:hypothetical protein
VALLLQCLKFHYQFLSLAVQLEGGDPFDTKPLPAMERGKSATGSGGPSSAAAPAPAFDGPCSAAASSTSMSTSVPLTPSQLAWLNNPNIWRRIVDREESPPNAIVMYIPIY